ncbi:multidrug efflux system membrane fusion protein [Marinobacterium sp. MBR-111]|uniref:efflux RND transporter periplasmic adaptor subunit n=1 Tax=Marinobacterium sp. MBR-111 TaxID=3156463 RepID=UPI0033997D3E
MKFKPGFGHLALLLTLALLVWLFSGELLSSRDNAPEAAAPVAQPITVAARLSAAQPYRRQIVLQGQVEPWQSVDLRAQISATVDVLPVGRGAQVARGDLLLQLSEDDRRSCLSQARAQLAYSRSQLEAGQSLRRQGLNAQTDLLRLQSELAAAEQAVRSAELELEHTRPVAPFAGVLDSLDVDLGDYLVAGQVWGRLLDTAVLRVRAQVPQQQVAGLELGQRAEVVLLDQRTFSGVVSHISREADSATRSFTVEIRLENPEGLRIAGASATVRIDIGSVDAHRISTALLTLGEGGQLGVLYLEPDDRVQFAPVQLISTGTEGSWVSGLPEEIRLITLGGGFVSPGQQVKVDQASESR